MADEDAWATAEHAIALPPVVSFRPGHVAVVPRRHVPRFYDLDVEEQRHVWELVSEAQRHLMKALHVDAVDIGFADSTDEQGHMVVHVVPRSVGVPRLPTDIEWVSL